MSSIAKAGGLFAVVSSVLPTQLHPNLTLAQLKEELCMNTMYNVPKYHEIAVAPGIPLRRAQRVKVWHREKLYTPKRYWVRRWPNSSSVRSSQLPRSSQAVVLPLQLWCLRLWIPWRKKQNQHTGNQYGITHFIPPSPKFLS